MTGSKLRTKIRELVAAGTLPQIRRRSVDTGKQEVANPCRRPAPRAVYHLRRAVSAVSVHAACDALWQQERERRESGTGDQEACALPPAARRRA